jgi:diguanylate cyclase (GGDEF)-like protein
MVLDSLQQEKQATLLVVDDMPANIHLLATALMDDYEILVATSGEDALELIQDRLPDLILLDVIMPGLSGHDVCRRLKEDPRTQGIPVIFITGQNEESDELEGLELGAVDYITKPFSLPIVMARVHTHLELKHYRDLLESLSYLDGLTGIPNRRRFTEHLDFVWSQAQRQRTPVAAILMDVDHFKAFNDHYGHQAGDECLTRVARAVADTERRTTSLVARYGGEEFICIVPLLDTAGALALAERLRASVVALALPHAFSSAASHVSISLGVASKVPQVGEAWSALLEHADGALYQAKEAGRNRACAAECV